MILCEQYVLLWAKVLLCCLPKGHAGYCHYARDPEQIPA